MMWILYVYLICGIVVSIFEIVYYTLRLHRDYLVEDTPKFLIITIIWPFVLLIILVVEFDKYQTLKKFLKKKLF